MMQHIVTKNTIVNGQRIAYGSSGKGEPVVLLHGTPSSSLIWRNVLPRLVDAGFEVYFFDLLGFGMSERPWDSAVDTSMTGQVPVLEAMLLHWGLTTFHLVAHDIGGGIAQRFAVSSPDRLRSLTLIDTVSFDSYPSQRTKEQMQRGLETLIKAENEDHRAHFREWLLSAVYDTKAFQESSLETFLGYISGPIGQASLFQHQIRHYDPRHTLEVASRLHELGRIPVQIVWGADDAWQLLHWGKKLHEAIPGSELHVLDKCGHFSPEDRPEDIARLFINFAKERPNKGE
ncbi:hypothetical protein NQ176_g1810 [Zarea fungicola]|uniref:Uncharacterized protein n=1 Tax=Zarea fungicola TaxID=93591 RepID=A0ACC1NSJ7_9HYPO|nr:hypothetical protein NQ176_g1810 [Lecanicillium fungicola]